MQPSGSAPPPAFDVVAEDVEAVPILTAGYSKLDFVPKLVNESPRWLRGVSAGLVFYADGEGPPVPRTMQAHIADRGSRVVRLSRPPGRRAPNGASLPLYEDTPLRVRHLPLHLANSVDLGPFDRRELKGGVGIQIPRPIGEAVLWRAALWVTAEGQPLTWFQVAVQSGASNDPHPRPAVVERLSDGRAPVVGYQLLEYVSELGTKVWSPGRDPIDSRRMVW